MSIKSKKWYENQIKALETACHNMGKQIQETPYNATDLELEQYMRYNSSVQKDCKVLYEKLNELRAAYSLYYRN